MTSIGAFRHLLRSFLLLLIIHFFIRQTTYFSYPFRFFVSKFANKIIIIVGEFDCHF